MTSRPGISAARRRSWSALLIGLAALAGCAAEPRPTVPPNASVGPRAPAAWPTPRISAMNAPAEIQAMHFSSLDVALGNEWSGEFVANSSTASIEVATNQFGFSVPRPRTGEFRFRFHLLDVPPFFVRAYPLRVIARNSSGEETVVVLPFRIRGRDSR
jgi:hypothetical protein